MPGKYTVEFLTRYGTLIQTQDNNALKIALALSATVGMPLGAMITCSVDTITGPIDRIKESMEIDEKIKMIDEIDDRIRELKVFHDGRRYIK